MDERCFEKVINLYAKIIIGGKTYDGYIGNVAQESSEYLMTCLIKVSENFKPKKIAEICFQLSSGETLNLSCELRWFIISPYDNSTEVLGMKIINPPLKYREFIESLSISPDLVSKEPDIDDVNHEFDSPYNQIIEDGNPEDISS